MSHNKLRKQPKEKVKSKCCDKPRGKRLTFPIPPPKKALRYKPKTYVISQKKHRVIPKKGHDHVETQKRKDCERSPALNGGRAKAKVVKMRVEPASQHTPNCVTSQKGNHYLKNQKTKDGTQLDKR